MVSTVLALCVSVSVVLLCSPKQVGGDGGVVVKTDDGTVRGSVLHTRQNDEILAFHGIRYAEPPIGVNRFKPPVPVRSWDGVYDANRHNVACHHPNPSPSYTLSEDCLLLDVYTKKLNSSQPVIVFVHGGGNLFGAKSDISPVYLLEQDVVLVSINYRLHALGFFSMGTPEAPGNNGYKDQVLALKWVQKNIHWFGGNPDRVTLNGHSAGGMSVSLHVVSPMSKGLFQRAIVMSGTAMSHYPSNTRANSRTLLERTNCKNDNVSLALECLNLLPIEKIAKHATMKNICTATIWNYDIEPANSPGERFLEENPTKTLLEGNFNRIPIMTGIIKDEFSYHANVIKESKVLFENFNKDYFTYAPLCFLYDQNAEKDKISASLREFYLENEIVTDENLNKLGELFSDSSIGFGVYRFVSLASLHTKVFFYRFDYTGKYSHFYGPDGLALGAAHGDELQFIYVFEKIAPVIGENDKENIIIEQMTRWWARFSETGNPNDPDDDQIKDVQWLPTTQHNYRALYINLTSHMGEIPFAERYAFWDGLFPLATPQAKTRAKVDL